MSRRLRIPVGVVVGGCVAAVTGGSPIVLGSLGGFLASRVTRRSNPPLNRSPSLARKQQLWAQLRAIPSLDETQRGLFVLIAHGESNYNPHSFNDDAVEREAASTAYDRLAEKLAQCGRSKSAFATGSGGRFGRLVPYYVNDLWDFEPCVNPSTISDGRRDLASAIHTAHNIQNHPNWQGTVLSIRAGWATLEWLANPPPEKVEKWQRHAVEAGLGADFIYQQVAPLPDDASMILRNLQRGTGLLHSARQAPRSINFVGYQYNQSTGRIMVGVASGAQTQWVRASYLANAPEHHLLRWVQIKSIQPFTVS